MVTPLPLKFQTWHGAPAGQGMEPGFWFFAPIGFTVGVRHGIAESINQYHRVAVERIKALYNVPWMTAGRFLKLNKDRLDHISPLFGYSIARVKLARP
jgi:hypothetical protein